MTFRCAPVKFTQILTIMCYYEVHQTWFPCLHAFLSTKSEIDYGSVFSFSVDFVKDAGNSLRLETVIWDFESALHKAILNKMKVKII